MFISEQLSEMKETILCTNFDLYAYTKITYDKDIFYNRWSLSYVRHGSITTGPPRQSSKREEKAVNINFKKKECIVVNERRCSKCA